MKYNNGSTRTYFPPLPETATKEEKAFAISYQEKFTDGTYIVAFVNGTIVKYNSYGSIMHYIVKPEFFFGEVIREDFADGSYALKYLQNRTVRFFPPPLPSTASKREVACALFYFDKFSNGTVIRFFFNGTIATYYNGVFLRYETKP